MNRPLSLVVDLDPLLPPTGPVAFPTHESDLLGKTSEDAVEKNDLEFYSQMMISNC